ncbi:glycoside hydrolase family 19 protein [Trichothermofontia sp.]
MDVKDIRAYRQMGINRLEQLLLAEPERIHRADFFVDTAIRQYSNPKLPDRPVGSGPYVGLYGTGASMQDHRRVAIDRLRELILPLEKFEDVDREIDAFIRFMSDLPSRPENVDPYVRLFVLPPATPEPGNLFPPVGGTMTSKQYITTNQLVQIAGSTELRSRIEALTPGVNQTFEQYQINTRLRMAHFLAQVMHESGGFRWLREIWGPTDAQRRYEGRRDLGNTQPGDGKRFMGRGLIQLTGRANYAAFSKDLGIDFVANPTLVEQPPYAVIVAGWYWDRRKLNTWADRDDLEGVTYRVNGGYNGLEDRRRYLNRAKAVLQ